MTVTYGLTLGGTKQPPGEGAGEGAQEVLVLELLLKPHQRGQPSRGGWLLLPCLAGLDEQKEVFEEHIQQRERAESWVPTAASPSLFVVSSSRHFLLPALHTSATDWRRAWER